MKTIVKGYFPLKSFYLNGSRGYLPTMTNPANYEVPLPSFAKPTIHRVLSQQVEFYFKELDLYLRIPNAGALDLLVETDHEDLYVFAGAYGQDGVLVLPASTFENGEPVLEIENLVTHPTAHQQLATWESAQQGGLFKRNNSGHSIWQLFPVEDLNAVMKPFEDETRRTAKSRKSLKDKSGIPGIVAVPVYIHSLAARRNCHLECFTQQEFEIAQQASPFIPLEESVDASAAAILNIAEKLDPKLNNHWKEKGLHLGRYVPVTAILQNACLTSFQLDGTGTPEKYLASFRKRSSREPDIWEFQVKGILHNKSIKMPRYVYLKLEKNAEGHFVLHVRMQSFKGKTSGIKNLKNAALFNSYSVTLGETWSPTMINEQLATVFQQIANNLVCDVGHLYVSGKPVMLPAGPWLDPWRQGLPSVNGTVPMLCI